MNKSELKVLSNKQLKNVCKEAQDMTADNVLIRLKTVAHKELTALEKRLVVFNKIVPLMASQVSTFSTKISDMCVQITQAMPGSDPYIMEYDGELYYMPFSTSSARAKEFVTWLRNYDEVMNLEFRQLIHFDQENQLYSYLHVVVLPIKFWIWLYEKESTPLARALNRATLF